MSDQLPEKSHIDFRRLIGKLWPWVQEVIEEGEEEWQKVLQINYREEKFKYRRHFVKYKITNRFTGSVQIKKEYLATK